MTAPVNLPKRADELEPGMTVVVSDTSTMTVEGARAGAPGKAEIRWQGVDLWASLPADQLFTVIPKETP